MSKREQVNAVLAEFASTHGAPALTLGENRMAGMRLADEREVFVLLDSDEERLFSCVEVRKLPSDPNLRLALLEICASMNFLGEGVGPTTLAVNNRGLFCQMELPTEELTSAVLEQGLSITLVQAGVIGEAVERAASTLSAALAEIA